MAKTATEPKPATQPAQPATQPALRLDTSEIKSSYCNVCNASSTREEVVLSLGINQGWEQDRAGEVSIKLLHRVILSPFAAKRLSEVLSNLIREYEKRYGELKST